MLSSSALIPRWSLLRKFAPLLTQTGSRDESAFLNQSNNKIPFFFHESLAFYEQASSRTS